MKNRFTGKTRIFLAISGIIIVVALIMQLCGAGINLGIDFTGGSLLTYSVGEDYDVNDVITILEAAGYTENQVTKTEPSEASLKLRQDMEEVAVEDAETDDSETENAEETASEEETVITGTLLSSDKSGIKVDGLTDLQIRLDLVDETKGLEDSVNKAVVDIISGAEKIHYGNITNLVINQKGYDRVFAGGFVAEYAIGADFDADQIKEALNSALTEEGYAVSDLEVIRYDAAAEAAAEAAEKEYLSDETVEPDEDASEPAEDAETDTEEIVATEGTDMRVLIAIDDQTTQVRNMLETEMSAKYPDFVFVTIDHVSAIAGKDLLLNAVYALLIAFACMLGYIAVRFNFYSGVVAMGALLHDVLIMCAFMVFFSWRYQANSPFIAAVLTIVGYSINNTIIIFDRIRENGKKAGFTLKPKIEIVELSVTQCLSRTINTSITTLITLIALYIFGVESIREFAFPLLIGMLAGTYSSVLLSGQVWGMWVDKINAKKHAAKAAD